MGFDDDQLLGSVLPGTVLANNTAFFSSALRPFQANRLNIHLSFSVDTTVEYTLDNATTWIKLNNGTALTASCGYLFTIPANPSHSVNLRQTSGGNSTAKIVEIYG